MNMEIESLIHTLIRNEERVCIYGTGLAAQMGCKALERLSLDCECFIDADEKKWGTMLCGKEIRDLKQISLDKYIFIMAAPEYKIHKRLQKAGFNKWTYIDPEILREYKEGYFRQIRNQLKANQNIINEVYHMLADNFSRKVFEYVITHRMGNRLDLVGEIYDKNQYFGNDLLRKTKGSVIDCGAYTGDTLRRFMGQLEDNTDYQYYAFEAERENYEQLINWCQRENLSKVQAYNIAVWDKREELSFENDENVDKVSGKIIETGNNVKRIQADSLDNILGSTKIDLIMMDIEGAEIKALNGARKIIENWNPCLAISSYHKIEHLWEIPLLIKELGSTYQVYLRHHRWNMDDTVCYGIPKWD